MMEGVPFRDPKPYKWTEEQKKSLKEFFKEQPEALPRDQKGRFA